MGGFRSFREKDSSMRNVEAWFVVQQKMMGLTVGFNHEKGHSNLGKDPTYGSSLKIKLIVLIL